ncbi:RagB/SusD family nutrient uptake outer membrane protein [Membranicola marinus]|uniref:RagB/SusD family nutrient uptake outer membrane protein n=1 Tax=Membranihabitans marinus TaxID=1227546 RepID=A0A953HWS7_9BACT|nr:RagB/SusD family nutrient uptake outer membrane protein [Membranihabitans marinus]MBY5957197.1 RagB/SusD family nutrient uptake outer membrane protein [Membranihabitans marinus]
MIHQYIIKIGVVISFSLMLFSCDEFLTIEPTTQVGDETLWSNEGNADLFLNNIYSGLPGSFTTHDPPENWSDNSMSAHSWGYSTTTIKTAIYTADDAPSQWGHYNDIRKANLFIAKVNAGKLSDDWKTKRLGEARFLRAYFYMLLWTHHGGVPIITDVLNLSEQGDEVFRARNTAEETYQFIVDELTAIEMDLPVNAEAGRASRGAALSLKGWCELIWASPYYNNTNDKSKWAKAAESYKKVIDLQVYDLFPNYNEQFMEGNNWNKETIFAKSYLGGTSLGGSREGLQGPWIVGGTQLSWSGVDPSQELVDEYFMANGLPIDHPDSGYDPQNPYANREKRFYESIIYDGSIWVGSEMVMKQGVGSRNETDLASKNESTNTGYYIRKGLNPAYAVNGPNRLNSANYIIFRFAEVLLGYAEAKNEAVGPDESVYEAINLVRARVDLPPLKDGLTQDEMRKAIYQERRVELAFEDKRYFDLLRLKLAEKNLNGHMQAMLIEKVGEDWVYKVIPATQGEMIFNPEKNYLFPIPQSAIDRNPNLQQNPNY